MNSILKLQTSNSLTVMSSLTFYKKISGSNKNIKYRYSNIPRFRLGPTTLGIVTLVIILLMSLMYLIQANSTATKGYEIEKEQEKIKKLESQSDKLELEMARLRSTKELNDIPQKLNLKPLPEEELGFIQFNEAAVLAGAVSEKDGLNPKR